MRKSDAVAIVDGYVNQLRRDMDIVRWGDGFCVVTPMLNRDNDLMSVYVSRSPSLARIEAIAARYGVSIKDCELYVEGPRRGVADRMNMLVQAMAAVDGMYGR